MTTFRSTLRSIRANSKTKVVQEHEEYLNKLKNCVEYKSERKLKLEKTKECIYSEQKKNMYTYYKKVTNKLFNRILFKMSF